jgi:hypothetical protein
MSEDGNWVPWSYTLFIGLNRPTNFYLEKRGEWELSDFLESAIGIEVVADFF